MRRNTIEIIYYDDNGLDHHVLAENLPQFAYPCIAQTEGVYSRVLELAETMRNYLRGKSQVYGRGIVRPE
jgi:hypothetical protein